MSKLELSEQERIRRESLEELRRIGIEPYPAEEYPINATSEQIKKDFESSPEKFENISLAGRIMSRRIMGKASFVELQDNNKNISTVGK